MLALVPDGSNIIAGGAFTHIGGQGRSYIASLEGGTGAATSWDPEAGGIVRALGRSALTIPPYTITIYAGGDFGSVGGQSRGHLAAIDESGTITTWNPGASGPVRAIAVARHGTIFNPYFTVFAGGDFTASGGQARDHLVEIDESGAATAWNPDADGSVYALALAGGKVYAGGAFPFLGGLARANIAQLSVATGAATSWAPALDGAVHALAVANGLLYVGGEFSQVGSLNHSYLASIDAATGVPTAWYAFPDGPVHAVMVLGNTVYVGGDFTHIGATIYPVRNHIAAVDGTTGDPTSWDPEANDSVHALAARILPAPPYTLTVYAGGFFTSIGGQTRNRIAEIDAAGLATSWDPDATDIDFPQFSVVSALAVRQIPFPYSYTVFAGGDFTMIGGQPRNYIAALDGSGAATGFDPHANSTVETIMLGDAVYAGGEFYAIGQPYQVRNGLAALDGATGQPLNWDAQGNGSVYALAGLGDRVYAGGSFTRMLGSPHDNVAALSTVTTAVQEPAPELSPATALRMYPNPFHPLLTLVLEGARGHAPWRVLVYDLEGRLVRTLNLHGATGVWDGNDDGGRPVPAGVYFCVLGGSGNVRAEKVVLVR